MLRKVDERLLAVAAEGLRIGGLRKSFGRTAVLNGIDLDVDKGELIAVLGPSGSGKTTLLRLLCGFERADAGHIELGGRSVARDGKFHVAPEQRGVGYVAQEGALFPHLSVAENLLFGLSRQVRKARNHERMRRVGELLELVDLPAHYAARKPAALSGGEQQRVALARALAPNPAVVLLDEPFSALDAALRAELRVAVVDSLARVHATALLVTHDQDEALSMGDRVAVLQNGLFAQIAAPQALYRFPANPGIARFVGDAVLTPGTIHAGMVDCRFGRLSVAPEAGAELTGPVDVMIRPEQFRIVADAASGTDSDGSRDYDAQVEQLHYYGHDAQLTLRLREGTRFTASVPGLGVPTPGQKTRFRVVGDVVAYPCAGGGASRDGTTPQHA